MRLSGNESDQTILSELGERVSRTRLNLNLTQSELAREAGVSRASVQNLEAGRAGTMTTFIRVLRALDQAGSLELLVPEPVPSPIEQLKLQGRRRRRARGPAVGGSTGVAVDWQWGDEPDRGDD